MTGGGKAMKVTTDTICSDLLKEVEEYTGEKVASCIQCGKCSGGCPMVEAMDLLPHQVMRLAQLGLKEDIMKSKTLWVCASCFTCTARCQRELDLSKVMEGFRVIKLRQKGGNVLHPKELTPEQLKDAPQQAIISGFRKYAK
jgi:heterodisulfide reductase subunit C2